MKRSGFKRQLIERKKQPLYRLERHCAAARITDEVRAMPKPEPVRDEAYRRLVAALPCIRCGIHGYSQAAHPNTGKGGGTKADDDQCFPLCTVHPGPEGHLVLGCHELFDSGGLFTKEERRAIEPVWSAQTAATLAMGVP